jgi:hypothetical protein
MDKGKAGTAGAKETGTARGTRGAENPNPAASSSGLDHQGNFRVGDRISIGVRGAGLVLTQSHSGREVEVSEAALAGLLDDTYFVDHKG